jgi:hypothetical protein
MLAGVASASSTHRYCQRFPTAADAHFRRFRDLWVSSVGLGTYLGDDADDATDARSGDAIRTALGLGCNLIDTAINYRCQRSERTIGAALAAMTGQGAIGRDEIVLCTKGGYLPFDGTVPACTIPNSSSTRWIATRSCNGSRLPLRCWSAGALKAGCATMASRPGAACEALRVRAMRSRLRSWWRQRSASRAPGIGSG